MYLLQSPNFNKFFENSKVFAEILSATLDDANSREEGTISEEQCRMVAQLCAETMIKHNLNGPQLNACDLKIFIDNDNSKEVRKYFAVLKKDARKDINSRALQLKVSWIQSVVCKKMDEEFQLSNRELWKELKEEFLANVIQLGNKLEMKPLK